MAAANEVDDVGRVLNASLHLKGPQHAISLQEEQEGPGLPLKDIKTRLDRRCCVVLSALQHWAALSSPEGTGGGVRQYRWHVISPVAYVRSVEAPRTSDALPSPKQLLYCDIFIQCDVNHIVDYITSIVDYVLCLRHCPRKSIQDISITIRSSNSSDCIGDDFADQFIINKVTLSYSAT